MPRSDTAPTQAAGRLGDPSIRRAAIGVACLTFICHAPSLWGEFLSYDDAQLIVDNAAYRGPMLEFLRWAFTTVHWGPYQPLSWITYAIDFAFWGLRPFGFHLTNVVLHSIAAGLCYLVAVDLLAAAGGSAATDRRVRIAAGFAALLFALHPLRVESVAWITERRDVLSGVWFFATVWFYVGAAQSQSTPQRRRRFAASLVCYTLCVLAKATAMTLPIALLVLDVYPLRRFSRDNKPGPTRLDVLIEKLPFLAVAAPIAFMALAGQRAAGAIGSLAAVTLPQRIAIAAYATCFYVEKTLLPIGLAPLYELPDPLVPGEPRFIIAAALATVATLAALVGFRRRPGLAAAWLCYLILLAPVSGLAQAGRQIAADRYSYLPCIGFAIILGAALVRLGDRLATRPIGRIAPGAIAIAILAALSVRQIGFWRGSLSVWQRAVDIDPRCAQGHYNLAILHDKARRSDLAAPHAVEAARLWPNSSDALWSAGVILGKLGRTEEGLDYLRRASELQSPRVDALVEYAAALIRAGRPDDARTILRRALDIQPDHERARGLLAYLTGAGHGAK
ncbi:MAG: tetratricopeptide repeat protein [Phycisphaerae bacterium]|nr:tetratricopeptide repeat protein [Phycisphaerae bacterium]